MNPKLRGWLQLLRVPNLFTAPGDALAGAALGSLYGARQATTAQLLCVGLAGICLYSFGLILNDLTDIEEDRMARPERPLVRQIVPLNTAWGAMIALLAAGLLAAFTAGPRPFATALVLAALILTYNRVTKPNPAVGPLNMGMCRGTSLMMGAAIAAWPLPAIAAAVGLTGYVADVTRLAQTEDQATRFGRAAMRPPIWFGAAALAVWLPALGQRIHLLAWLAAPLIAAIGCMAVWLICRDLAGRVQQPASIQRAVGRLLRLLIALQAAFMMLAAETSTVILAVIWLAILLPASHAVARQFASS